jgi:WD40 repeat protein
MFQCFSNNITTLQVKYVLGKVAERWQQVMVERARLKVQVARLEKTKQELLAQVQSLSIENTALKQGISMQCRPVMRPCPAEPQGDLEHDRRCAGYVPESGLQGFGRDTTSENPPCYLSNLSFSELGYGGSEPGYSSFRVPTRRPPPKVEERLGAPKWELAHSFSMHSGPVHGIAVNPSGNLVATASWDHLCRVYDVHLEEEVAVLAGHLLGLYAVKFSPAKRDLVGTVSSDQTCRLWSTETGACVRVLECHTDEVLLL